MAGVEFGADGIDFYPRPPRGGRPHWPPLPHSCLYFYPRPPRGGRPTGPVVYCGPTVFLSTPSARRATPAQNKIAAIALISIHALREEGDRSPADACHTMGNFYPRPPRGGRPVGCFAARNPSFISIHALREEGDPAGRPGPCRSFDFYPRPPRGGRRQRSARCATAKPHKFLSTPSARRAT